MALNDFNLGNEAQLDLVEASGTLIDIGGLCEFEARQESDAVHTKPLANGGKRITRTIYNGWTGSFKFDRMTAKIDALAQRLEQNYLDGNPEIYFQIMQTIRDPQTGQVNQYQYEQVSLALDEGGSFRADEKVSQTIKFFAARRLQLT
jgi:hypothetical protein